MYAGRAGAEGRAPPPATSIIFLPLPLPVPQEGVAKLPLYSHSDVLSPSDVLGTVLGAGSTATNCTRPSQDGLCSFIDTETEAQAGALALRAQTDRYVSLEACAQPGTSCCLCQVLYVPHLT